MAKSWSPNNLGLWTSCKKNGGQPVHFTVCPWCLGIPIKSLKYESISGKISLLLNLNVIKHNKFYPNDCNICAKCLN